MGTRIAIAAAVALAGLALAPGAFAQSADLAVPHGAVVVASGLIPSTPAGSRALTEEDLDIPAIIVGRGQDIVGAPVDFSRMRRPGSGGGRGGVAGPGFRGLPSFARMPGRMPLVSGSMTSSFGMRRHPIYGDMRLHSGVDLAAPMGTPVYATSPGYVSSATWSGGYGLLVAVEHGGGVQTRYGHLSRLAVGSGQYVEAGTVIGYVGSTGNSTGPHLHYEVRINGYAVNPVGTR